MSLELSVAISVLKAAIPGLAKTLVSKINSELNPTDLEKALEAGSDAAVNWDATQSSSNQLFYNCGDKEARDLLARFFKDTGVQEELQKPLKHQGTPDIDFLILAFTKAGSEPEKLQFPENSIEHWLKIFADTYFEKTSAYLRFELAKKDYLKQLASCFDDVKFAGIAVEGQEVEKSAHLAQIFVMPDVEESHTNDVLPLEYEKSLEGTLGKRQAKLLWEQRHKARLEQSAGRKFPAQQILSQTTSRKFVLLGEPGSGKTTLLSYFAVTLAQKKPENLGLAADTELLPILIRIRDLERNTDISILEYLQQFACNNLSVKTLPPGFFEYWLEDGRALILLDGLDEVADLGKCYKIVERIQNFLRQYSQNRAIITSRPAGYRRGFFRTEEFPHYNLQLFDEAKIELFIKNWYESRCKEPEEAQRRGENLKKAIAEQDRIKLLARNPLLLTIISLIHRYEAHLPRQRHKLYDKAVKTLLTNWDKGKDIDDGWPLEYLKRDDIERLMQQLAYWIHAQGSSNNKDGGTLIDSEKLIAQLSEYIAKKKRIERYQAKEEAKRFLKHIRERAGLLNEQGQDCYAFVHKTFQEYLAAEDIRYRQEDEDIEVVLEEIRKHLHDAHWREVLLLLIAQQKPMKATQVLKEILKQPTPYENLLHRNLLFAGRCLAEDIEVSDESLVAKILQALVNLEISPHSKIFDKIQSQVFQTLCCLSETDFEAKALQLLKDSAARIDELRLQKYRAVLGEEDEAIATLLARLQDEAPNVRLRAAWALGDLSNASEYVIQALVSTLEDEDSKVRSFAAWALSKLGNTSDLVIQKLMSQLQDEDAYLRLSAAWGLGSLGNTSDLVIEALLNELKDDDYDEDSAVAISAAMALRDLGKASESLLIHGLLNRLQNGDCSIRYWAAFALGELGNASKSVIEALLNRLEDEDSDVRYMAACSLARLGDTSQLVVQVLLNTLEDEDSDLRSNAVWALGHLRDAPESVIKALLNQLQDEDLGLRSNAAWALGNIGNASESVIEALLSCLKHEDWGVLSSAALALVKLGKPSSEIAAVVGKWLEQHQDSEDVGDAIDTLWGLVAGENSLSAT
ncbi:HEAT repeat domain-containing protein [Microcoleus sp. FACHB-831]|uniref:NACHT domain-containing protein n=1 Tax=Microcoleus sp. FACHB-831 TaxID=2692827 RepID=UPI00168249B0|nr:HEAT repeat domain-containing protein [Microcoleus sp. FACHB-831]MBD1921274.1 HEAT repeat domain-containing protein [Microcoleus sp. FACHB-831]